MKASLVGMAFAALLWAAPTPGQPAPHAGRAEGNAQQESVEDDQGRFMRVASLEYTIAVIALGGLGLLVSIAVLCMPPPVEREPSDR